MANEDMKRHGDGSESPINGAERKWRTVVGICFPFREASRRNKLKDNIRKTYRKLRKLSERQYKLIEERIEQSVEVLHNKTAWMCTWNAVNGPEASNERQI